MVLLVYLTNEILGNCLKESMPGQFFPSEAPVLCCSNLRQEPMFLQKWMFLIRVDALIMLMSIASLRSISLCTGTIYNTMKTLSVKQVAEVLGVGTRAIIKRLDKKQLKGTRRVNKYGTEEWWIYPNNEIKAALEKAGRIDILGPRDTYSDADIIDLDEELIAPDEDEPGEDVAETVSLNPGAWTNEARDSTLDVADGVWNNIIGRFLGELKERDQLIGEMRGELADKDRQLRLLPDFQKEAEIRRQDAESQELKAIALAKQIQAMQDLAQSKALEVERLTKLETEIMPSLERQLEQERVQKEKDGAEATARLSALESDKREVEEAKAKLEESLQKEIDRLKEEKGEQAKAIQSQFEILNQKLEKLEKPQQSWWKKFFASPDKDTKS
jgi:hypothetical protein